MPSKTMSLHRKGENAYPGFSTPYTAPSARGMAGVAYPGFSTFYAAPSARGMGRVRPLWGRLT